MAGLPILFVALLTISGITFAEEPTAGRVDCIFSSLYFNRQDEYSIRIEDIPLEYCTHVIYDNMHLELGTLILMPSNPQYDLVDNGWQKFVDLKKINPKLKLLMSIKSALTSMHIETAEDRAKFVQSIVWFLEECKFDGISILWYGYWRNEGSEEGSVYKLFEELRSSFVAAGHPEWEANVMIIIDNDEIDHSRICKVADTVSLMSVLDHINKPNGTNVAAPLKNESLGADAVQNISINHSLQKWLDNGCPANKIMLGFAFMGPTFALKDPNKNGLGSPITGRGEPCPHTFFEGSCAYFETCQKFNESEWTIKWDEGTASPYAFQGNQWISFENEASIERKAKFARSKGLAGAFGIKLSNDDYRGKCGERYPLTKALWKGFRG